MSHCENKYNLTNQFLERGDWTLFFNKNLKCYGSGKTVYCTNEIPGAMWVLTLCIYKRNANKIFDEKKQRDA